MWSADFIGTLYNNLIYIIAGVVIVIVVIAAALFLRRKKTPPPSPLTQPQQIQNKNDSQSNS
jgi:LPXTG-motif cell wall-anchored protein